MRTTVDVDPDLLEKLRVRAHESGRSFREELNLAIARGLRDRESRALKPFDPPVHSLGAPLVDLTKAMQLLGEWDVDDFNRKSRQDR